MTAWWPPACAVAFLYASYHLPVVWRLQPSTIVILAFPFLVGLGLTLQLLVERFGLVLTTLVHCAFDIVACLILSDILWDWGIR